MKHAEVLKHCINVLAVVLLSAIAFLFTAYGLLYKNVNFIIEHFDLLFWLTAGVCAAFIVIGIAFYVAKKRSLYRLVVCALVFFDMFAVIFFAMCATGMIATVNSVEALREYISRAGGMAALLFILFCFLQVVLLPVPGSVAVAAGVAMFGPLQCAIYSFLVIVEGSIVEFDVGRW